MSRPCLIAYDVANPRRLVRLHRALKRYAVPIQYSVFHAELSRAALAEVSALIESIIDPRQDDVRIYLLPRDGWARSLGRRSTPSGVFYTALPLPFHSAGDIGGEAASRLDEADAGSARVAKPQDAAEEPPSGDMPGLSRQSKKGARVREARALEARVRTGRRAGLLLI